ncbi:MAG TPA: VWA domain-containing protein [Thermoanaerobaculia bacterium]|nr:VWA domain-containing protein [Thermoanaerobaculia bacterium]
MIQRFSALLSVSLLLLPLPVPAQSPAAAAPAQNDETFYDTVEVNVVNVEVFVTDRSGQRVNGLTQSDFEVLEDGKPVEITNFFASEGGRAATTVLGTAAPATPEAAEIPEEQRLLLAIFVDNSNLSARARNSALPKVNEFLKTRLRTEDRVILSSYDGPGSLEVRAMPTGDPATVVAALDRIARGTSGRMSGGAELRMLISQMDRSANPAGVDKEREMAVMDAKDILAQIELYAEEERAKTAAMVSALEQFVDGLSGLPGRKAVLLLSGGVPLRPAQALYEAWERRFGTLNQQDRSIGGSRLNAADVDLGKEMDKIGARANANRITFYALGVTDSVNVTSAAASTNDLWTRTEDSLQTNNMAQSLYAIVDPTGGAATINALDPGVLLAEMREDMDSFYSLGYTPLHRRSGKSHKIEVKVKRPGLKLRHRESYRERTSAEVMSDKVLAALMFGSRENPLEIGLQLGEEVSEKGKNTVQLTVKLPMSKLVLLPQGQFHEGKVTIFMAVRDTQGRSSPVTEVKLPIRVPNDQLLTSLGQLAGYRAKLALRPVEHTVAVGVRDELGNIVSTVTASYTPGLTPEASPAAPAATPEPAGPTEGRGDDHDR